MEEQFNTSTGERPKRLYTYPIGQEYELFEFVEDLYEKLKVIGPVFSDLEVYQAYLASIFNNSLCSNPYVLITLGHYIEAGVYNNRVNTDLNEKYILLVNRVCARDQLGTVAPTQTITVELQDNPTTKRIIEDLYISRSTGNRDVTATLQPNEFVFQVDLEAGEGRLFQVNYPPAAPQNLQQVATYGQSARLTWDANTEPDLRRYRIYRKSDMYGTWEARAYTTATTWTDPEVIIGPPMTTWYWKIKAQDWAWNNSDFSNTVSAIGLIKPAVNNPDEIPDTYMITQNYPNPFNPNTTITFDLPEDNFINLVVYDINGKLVAILANNQLSAGRYNVNFDASHLPSGLYFYKISAGSFTKIKRMLLIR